MKVALITQYEVALITKTEIVFRLKNKRPVGLYSSAEFYAGSATEAIFVRILQESIKYCRSSSNLNETWMKTRPKNKKIQISKI